MCYAVDTDDMQIRSNGAWADMFPATGGSGDSARVEDGNNAGTFTAMGDIDFDDSGDINFTRGAGPPDVLTATVRADSVALTTDTSGNYAAGDGEAGAALTGDSATDFFSAGTVNDARIDGSAGADELVLAGDVDGAANANDIDEAAVEGELEGVLDLADLQGTLTVPKGGTGAAPGADDQVLVSDSTSAATWRAVPDCNTENHLTYETSTNAFGCEADDGGGGGGDNLRVEDGNDTGAYTAATDADFSDQGDIN